MLGNGSGKSIHYLTVVLDLGLKKKELGCFGWGHSQGFFQVLVRTTVIVRRSFDSSSMP
jgi:hypothetical protein